MHPVISVSLVVHWVVLPPKLIREDGGHGLMDGYENYLSEK